MVSAAYVFPSPLNRVVTEIVPSDRRYADEKDFLRRADLGPGARYIRVVAQESLGMASGPRLELNESGTAPMGTDLPALAVVTGMAMAVAVSSVRRRAGGSRRAWPRWLRHSR